MHRQQRHTATPSMPLRSWQDRFLTLPCARLRPLRTRFSRISWTSVTSLALESQQQSIPRPPSSLNNNTIKAHAATRADIKQTPATTFCGVGRWIKTNGRPPISDLHICSLSMCRFPQQRSELWTECRGGRHSQSLRAYENRSISWRWITIEFLVVATLDQIQLEVIFTK